MSEQLERQLKGAPGVASETPELDEKQQDLPKLNQSRLLLTARAAVPVPGFELRSNSPAAESSSLLAL
jgi:hypothetical protein